MSKKLFSLAALLLFALPSVYPQAAGADLNEFYQFPIGIAVEYQTLTPLAAYNTPYNIFDVAGQITVPLPMLPVLQPYLRGGMMRFDSIDAAAPDKWDHYHIYGTLGISYVNRIVKNFEFGADLSAGASEAIFPNVVDTGTVGSPFLLFSAGAKVSLVPSYSFSIDFHPNVRYLQALGPLNTFNGFLFSFGFAASYRFGEDPDSARAIIRSLRFEDLKLPSAFSAMQGFYAKNPLGQVTLVNTERQPVTDVEVSFFQPGYMDSPTASASIARIPSGGNVRVPILAVFNKQVFSTEGVTPLTGEIIVTYKLASRPVDQRSPVTYDLYDKTAIVWDEDRKVAAFITPQDSALKNYTAFISQAVREASLPNYNESIQTAMQVYAGLREIGLLYQVDAASPFTKVQGQGQLVDSVTLPRLTLKRRYGDCDDLTVLFCSLLETQNVETGFITVPGHIYAAFNTNIQATDFKEITPDRSMVLTVDNKLWIPLEVTMLDGNNGFQESWARGIALWNASEKERRFYKTRDAQKIYTPVALQETDLGLQYGSKNDLVGYFTRDRDRLSETVTKSVAAEAARSNTRKDYNRLGILYARFGRYGEAETALENALKVDPKYVGAMVNLGNVQFLRKEYQKAIDVYKSAIAQSGKDSAPSSSALKLIGLLNLSRVYNAIGKADQAKSYFAQADKMDHQKASEYAYLATADSGSSRAADEGSAGKKIIFSEEE